MITSDNITYVRLHRQQNICDKLFLNNLLVLQILWGHRFEPLVSYNKDRQGYEVNYSKFDNTFAVDTPLCSGAELAEFYKLQDVPGKYLASAPPTPNH